MDTTFGFLLGLVFVGDFCFPSFPYIFLLEETNAFSVSVEMEHLHWDILEAVFLATCM